MCSYHSVNPGFSHPLPSSKEKKLIRLTFPLSALPARRPVSENEGGGEAAAGAGLSRYFQNKDHKYGDREGGKR